MPTTPPTITVLPTPPTRNDSTTFATRGDAFMAALPTFATQTNSAASNVYANAVEGAASASAALAAQNAASASQASASSSASMAAASAGAALWVTGTNYAQFAVVLSPSTLLTYRRKTASGVSTTDPAVDTTNWVLSGPAAPQLLVVSAASTNAAINGHYILTGALAQTVVLPASPNVGDVVTITVANDRTDAVVNPGSNLLMSLAEAMTLNAPQASINLRYVSALQGWRIC